MKKQVLAIALVALAAIACNKKEEDTTPLAVDFEISANPCFAKDEVTFTAKVSGGQTPYTYEWKVGDAVTLEGETASWTPEENGTFIVRLNVSDAKGKTGERAKNLVVNPAEVVATGEVTLLWTAPLQGYTSMTTPAVADDGSIYTVTRDANKLYKIDKDGKKVWEQTVIESPQDGSQILGTPSIDTDGTIYIAGGSKNGDAVLAAFKPDGSLKWRFKDFWAAAGATLSPSINGITAGIGDNNVYIGNCGTTGTIISVAKADGSRVNHMMDSNGKGPAGGARAGILITKDGYACWSGGAYGIFGVPTSVLDTKGDGANWSWRGCYSKQSGWPDGNNSATLAAITVNGKNALVGMQSLKADADLGKEARTKVYAIEVATGEEIANVEIDACAKQDQGGIAITEEGYVIATLKYNLGQADGGIALVDVAQQKMVAHYGVMENVSAAPAIDAAGNILFATETGNFYMVKYNGSEFETLVKVNIADLVGNDSRYAEAYAGLVAMEDGERVGKAKIWSGIVIGDDGTIYVQFTDNNDRTIGGLAAIKVDYTTGPSTVSPWPMMGQNRKHTNRQK